MKTTKFILIALAIVIFAGCVASGGHLVSPTANKAQKDFEKDFAKKMKQAK